MNKLTDAGYTIPRKTLTVDQLIKLKEEMTVVPKYHEDYQEEPEAIRMYSEDKDNIYLPKIVGLQKFGKPKKVEFNYVKSPFEFNGKLREKQQAIVDKCIPLIKENYGGTISLPCGGGKTVLGLYIAHQLGLKTLIVVHKSFLLNQWYERIKQFTNARVGIIRSKKIDVKNKDIVIGMIQSLSMIDYDPEIFKDFGFVVFDEVHHAGARVFSQSLRKTTCLYSLGLSATPTRNDGLFRIIEWHLGKIIHQETSRDKREVKVGCLEFTSDEKKFQVPKAWIKGKIVYSTTKMITRYQQLKFRDDFIVDMLDCLRQMEGRKILILGGRINHLEYLKNRVDSLVEKDVKDGRLEEGEFTTSMYIGKMKQYELDTATEADCIFATDAMAEEGLDIPELNTIIFATPKKNVIQCVGRILRKEEAEYVPLILDIFDSLPRITNWSSARQKYYTKNKYVLTTHKIRIENKKRYIDKGIGVQEMIEGIINAEREEETEEEPPQPVEYKPKATGNFNKNPNSNSNPKYLFLDD